MKILLVEDSEDWKTMATDSLKDAGFEVVAVSGTGEALLQTELPGLVLIVLDLDLGGENGLMLMKHLKRRHPDIPIIIYTGMQPEDEAVQRMRDQGATRLLRKGPMSELIQAAKEITAER